MRELLRRIWYLFHRRRLERELADEMAYHRELMPPGRRADFGSDLRMLEDAREAWGWAWLDRLGQDLKYGGRVLRHSPGFTVTAMLVLGLGIGVPLTAFRELLYDLQANSPPDPDTMVQLTRRAAGLHITVLPYPALAFYAANAHSFRQVIGVSQTHQATFGDQQIHLVFATANYFPEFGTLPARGRLFSADDERQDTEPPALVAESFWQRSLGADPAILGRTIAINGKPVRIVGVMPRSPRSFTRSTDVWMPLARQPYVLEGSTLLTDWNSALDVYARLSPGVSPKASEQETRALGARLHDLRPTDVRQDEYLDARPILRLDHNGSEFQIALTAAALVMLLLAAACANLGNLVLARGVAREREIRTRLALGAGRSRVVRQLFTESLLLAALSAAAALLLSSIVLKIIQLRHNPDVAVSLFPGWGVLAATAAVSVLAALFFGLPPALRLTSLAPRGGRARTIFLGAQVAASCLLLVVSSLLVGGMQRLRAIDPGIDYRHLVWISPGLKAHGYNDPAAQAFLGQLRARTAGLPGVQSASAAWLPPWGNVHFGTAWSGHRFAGNHVDPRFLDTMGMRLVRGRNFRPGENDVAILTEASARLLWPDQDALGKALPWDAHGPTIIGVVRNASTTAVGAAESLEFYLPLSGNDAPQAVLVLRVSGKPRDSVRILKKDAARGIDSRLQPDIHALTEAYDAELEKISRMLAVITILGAVSVLLASIGLAGLAGYTVAQRTREIGLRLALGAGAGQIVQAMFAPMVRPIAIGFLVGALGGSAVVKMLSAGASGIASLHSFDPLAYLAALLFFVAIVAVACSHPIYRAIHINPTEALQYE
jgi:predicted permease